MEGSSRLYDYGDILIDTQGVLYIYINDLDSDNELGIIDVAIINGENYGMLTKINEQDSQYKLLSNYTFKSEYEYENTDKIFLSNVYRHIYQEELYVIEVRKDTDDEDYFYTVSLTWHPGRLIKSKKKYFNLEGMAYFKVVILDYSEEKEKEGK